MNCSDLAYDQATSTATRSGIISCFAFAGKEKGLETGLSYFGARYYDADLTTGWLSVDPMADKYPSMSPYIYCAGNPVKLVDPDGEEVFPTKKKAQKFRERAVDRFGENRVGDVRNYGTNKNPNYGFYVYGRGKDKKSAMVLKNKDSGYTICADRPDEKILSGIGLCGYSLFKNRKNRLSIRLSIGGQAGVSVNEFAKINAHLGSIDLIDININNEEGNNCSLFSDNINPNQNATLGIEAVGIEANVGISYYDYGGNSFEITGIVREFKRVHPKRFFRDLQKGNYKCSLDASLIFGVKVDFSSIKE